jgi:hypothetical protein
VIFVLECRELLFPQHVETKVVKGGLRGRRQLMPEESGRTDGPRRLWDSNVAYEMKPELFPVDEGSWI